MATGSDTGLGRPLIFVSHHGKDRQVAEAFARLIKACTGDTIRCFYSSASSGEQGIPAAADWYEDILDRIDECSELIALLTPRSFQRPWILWEAGYAKGLGKNVCGLAVGKPLHEVRKGPFEKWQNKDSDPDSLVGLIQDLVRRNRGGVPDKEDILPFIERFSDTISKLSLVDDAEAPRQQRGTEKDRFDEVLSVVARQHEELKALIARQSHAPGTPGPDPEHLEKRPRYDHKRLAELRERVSEAIVERDSPAFLLSAALYFNSIGSSIPHEELSEVVQVMNSGAVDSSYADSIDQFADTLNREAARHPKPLRLNQLRETLRRAAWEIRNQSKEPAE